ncbi:hypothetical protein Tco_0011592 [Tanacetum coccineum]
MEYFELVQSVNDVAGNEENGHVAGEQIEEVANKTCEEGSDEEEEFEDLGHDSDEDVDDEISLSDRSSLDDDYRIFYYQAIDEIWRKARVLEHKRRIQESLLILTTNTPYHSRNIRCIQRIRRIQDHCLTLKNTAYPIHQIRRIPYTVLCSTFNETRSQANTPYTEDPIRRIGKPSQNIPEDSIVKPTQSY